MDKTKTIFIIEDNPTIRQFMESIVRETWNCIPRLFPDGNGVIEALDEDPDVVILDIILPNGVLGTDLLKKIKELRPSLPVIMISAQTSIDIALETLRNGATDYVTKPIDFNRLENVVRNAIQSHDLAREVERLRDSIGKASRLENVISHDGRMEEIFRSVQKVMDTPVSVLIEGESGTGKELIARAIHFNGLRKEKPFVVVNCASIPRELLESELFGHERGSFTGAVARKIGKFEQADGGTIFLDEVGELEMNLQAKLLRVLQSKEFERVGGNQLITSDVRVISATNRDLHEAVTQKAFREDLYYRLASFPITLPPLRERKSDILLLAEHFLRRAQEALKKPPLSFSKGALKLLYYYSWPGNIRELEHAVERAAILADSDTITEKDLPIVVQSDFSPDASSGQDETVFSDTDPIRSLEWLKEQSIRHALRVTGGNVLEAAERLKLGRATLYRLAEKYNIQIERK
jgi:DNA-binding NtrC family response regulator